MSEVVGPPAVGTPNRSWSRAAGLAGIAGAVLGLVSEAIIPRSYKTEGDYFVAVATEHRYLIAYLLIPDEPRA